MATFHSQYLISHIYGQQWGGQRQ